MEKELMKFKLPMIENLSLVNAIVIMGFRKTGNKFSVVFNGSKGYISNIEIYCEGVQKESNRIFVESLRNKNNSLKSVMVTIFYSKDKGVRVQVGKPSEVPTLKCEGEKSYSDNDDLPF